MIIISIRGDFFSRCVCVLETTRSGLGEKYAGPRRPHSGREAQLYDDETAGGPGQYSFFPLEGNGYH